MSTKPQPKRPDGVIATLAKQLGFSARYTSALLAKGMPDDSITAARKWISERENSDTSAAELRKERVGLVRAQRLSVEAANKKADGLVVSRAECQEAWTQLATALGRAMQMAAREIPQVCLGLPIFQSLPLAREKMNKIQTMFSDAESAFWLDRPEKNTTTKP